MDRNTVIGFILIVAVLLLFYPLWSLFFPSAPVNTTTPVTQGPPTGQPERIVTPESLATTLSSPPANISDTTAQASQPIEPEHLINISTKNLIVTLSSYGGTVRQVTLKNHSRYDGRSYTMLGQYSSPDWAKYGALTIGYEDKMPTLNSSPFQVSGGDKELTPQDSIASVTFTYSTPNGGLISKMYIFHYAEYLFGLKIDIQRPAEFGLGNGITIGWYAPAEPSEKDLNQDKAKLGGYFNLGGDFLSYKGLKGGTLRQAATGPINWVATKTKYFTAVILADSAPAQQALVVGHGTNRVIYSEPSADTTVKYTKWDQYGIGMTYENPDPNTSLSFTVYTGPLDYDKLHKMGHGLPSLVDFGWKYFRPFAIAILWLFTAIHAAIANYGFVIIVFSIIMKVIFWPLSLKSAKSMYKMREIQPVLNELKQKHKNDPARLNQETMKAYREYGVNPFGSCLPMLIQLPIFWALYSVLSNTIELRGAPFVLWIKDLSQPDPTGKFFMGIGILPIFMGLAMFFQQKMTITDPKQKMMVYMMPVLFTFLFSRWASGLVLYWTVFSVVGIFEQWLVMRHIKAEQEAKQRT